MTHIFSRKYCLDQEFGKTGIHGTFRSPRHSASERVEWPPMHRTFFVAGIVNTSGKAFLGPAAILVRDELARAPKKLSAHR